MRKRRGLNTILNTSDLGGYDSIAPLVRAGVITANELDPDKHDPWIWVNDAVTGGGIDPSKIGLVIFDSGTSIGEALLTACHKADFQVGQQKTQRFAVSKGTSQLNVTINNEAHYGVVQNFMLEKIWKSMNLARKGVDVLWTFSVLRGEEQDRTPILGPKLAGKALTAAAPKWFKYTWRIASVPQEGSEPIHRLYLTEYPELAGLGHSFGNSRVPLGGDPLPPYLEPASIPGVFDLLAERQAQADLALAAELGL